MGIVSWSERGGGGRGLRGNPQAPLPQWERRKGERGERREKIKDKREKIKEKKRGKRRKKGERGKGREERGREGN